MSKIITDNQIRLAIELYWKKAPHTYIAEQINIHPGTVKKVLQRNGIGYKFNNFRNNTICRSDIHIDAINGKILYNYNNEPMTEFTDKDGYKLVHLEGKMQRVHRIIAEELLPNEYNKETVNHKDGNKANNSINNLEWATYSEQMIHSANTLKNNYNVPYKYLSGRKIRDNTTGKIYDSVSECARKLKITRSKIYMERQKGYFSLLEKGVDYE